MSDMVTIYLDRGEIKGAKLTYLGVHNNVVNSLMAMCAVFGVELTLVCPLVPEGAVDHKIKERIQERSLLVETLDKETAVREADYVYTDTWLDMEFFSDPKYQKMKEERVRLMLPYQISAELMKDSKAKIMHDMPIHAGYEISEEMVSSPDSIIFTQSSNRLPTQKAIILSLLNKA
jgi:ornithine carbamoyltransferase